MIRGEHKGSSLLDVPLHVFPQEKNRGWWPSPLLLASRGVPPGERLGGAPVLHPRIPTPLEKERSGNPGTHVGPQED